MKYDINRKPTRSAKRVLEALSEALFEMLCKKSFEELTVGEICDECGYPRATFYNYFDDKYDLLNFYWYILSRQIKIDDYKSFSLHSTLDDYFEHLYNLLNDYKVEIKKLLTHNSRDGYFITQCKIHLTGNIKVILADLLKDSSCPVPNDILAEHIANTILLIFGKHFDGSDPDANKEKTKVYIDFLLKSSNLK